MFSSKTKIVLIRPEYTFAVYSSTYNNQFKPGNKQVATPMQLMQIGGALVRAGHDVRIIDGEAESLGTDQLVERIVAEAPDIVGVTSTTPEYFTAREILEKVKRRIPFVKTVIGGAHATHVPWDLCQEIEGIDHVVIYEGEKAMIAIANGDRALVHEYSDNAIELMNCVGAKYHSRIKGIPLLGESQSTEDLEQTRPLRGGPWIDMRHYLYSDPELGLVMADSVETARGCPFSCTFCSSARSGLGMRSVENVLEELELLHRNFQRAGHRGFVVFLDDTLTLSRSRAVELFEGIERRGLRMHYSGFTRANTIASKYGQKADTEFAALMKRVGFRSLSFGIETGSERINEGINKAVTLDDYRRAYQILNSVNFEESRGSFIVGHPYETASTVQESIRFAKELGIQRIGVNIMTPYPGTQSYEIARNGKGLYFEADARKFDKYRRWGKSVVSTEELSAGALEYWHQRFLAEIYGSWHCVKHGLHELSRGNLSSYYHRPVVSAVKKRLREMIVGEWNRTPVFETPDHSGYNPGDWGQAQITKSDCLDFLRERYQTRLNRKTVTRLVQIPN